MAFTWRIVGTLARLSKNAPIPSRRFLSISAFRCGGVIPFKLSDIGEGIRDVTIKEWYVKPGDKVNQFDKICEVQSDKASVTITSRYDGTIEKLHYETDGVALVGSTLLDICVEDNVENDEVVTRENEKAPETSPDVRIDNGAEAQDENLRTNAIEKALATPAVRRIAMEHNVNLKDVVATGKGGRVLKEDILAYLERKSSGSSAREIIAEKPPAAGTVRIKKYSKHMWKTMTQSLSIPHFVYSDECNVTELTRYRNEVKDHLKEQGVTLSLMPFFIKAASRALQKIPELNAWLDEANETIKVFDRHNIGIAMDTPEGLVVPNVKNVQDLSIVEIAKELNRLQELGRTASLPLNDLSNGTFTLSNIGVVGGTYTKPVILPPQIVIGALGRVRKLPRFDAKENVVAANIISVSWAADHRIVDGVTMARYSNYWKHYVENPTHLLIGA